MLPKLDLSSLRAAYTSGEWTPATLLDALSDQIEAAEPSRIWISRLTREALRDYARNADPARPLYGIPFAIKDNIDLAGLPTTAGCPEYAYQPDQSAFVVQRLIEAGAIPIGKTNLDQFATGLVGVRSPYGFPANAFHPDYIPGGSSSGSAIAVARGFAAFALGTDTAGSGRVPAAFNNLVGLKPSRGLLSCSGVVPACRSLDCVSIFAHSSRDAADVFQVATSFDPSDPYARRDQGEAVLLGPNFRFAVPREDQLQFFGKESARNCFREAIGRMQSSGIGGKLVEIDFTPFLEAARLLYEGPWLAERYVVLEGILRTRPEILHPVTREIVAKGKAPSASDAFKAEYRRLALKREADKIWEVADVLVTPTAGTIYKVAEVEADPLGLNTNLGYYTNFMNLLDYSAAAVPAGFMDNGLPFGITICAPAFQDRTVLAVAQRWENMFAERTSGLPDGWCPIVVCGAHMDGLPLNHQLTSRKGRFLEKIVTASVYRLYALPSTSSLPPRPGMVRVSSGGESLEAEVWALPVAGFGDFVRRIPPPLGIGNVEISDGRLLPGFLCESYAVENAPEITALKGWRNYLASLAQ